MLVEVWLNDSSQKMVELWRQNYFIYMSTSQQNFSSDVWDLWLVSLF